MEIDVTPETDQSENVAHIEDPLSDTSGVSGGLTSSVGCLGGDKEVCRQSQSKKVIKHALRQQAKRRRKNTTIASGNATTVPRIIVKPLPPPVEEVINNPVPIQKTPTMREVLASIPGFSIKPRKRSNKKLSTAAQLEQTKEGCIDLETPDSILVNTNLRGLLNKYTFAALPPLYQNKLVQLLPSVDRQVLNNSTDASIRLSTSGLNNEFFARACLEWQERLAEGEFTPENQQKLKTEADKERSRLDPWKLKHFEPIWGDRSIADGEATTTTVQNNSRPPIKTTIKLRQSTTASNKQKPTPLVKRIRTVGAMTRSCTTIKEELSVTPAPETITRSPIPDLLPIKSHKLYKNDQATHGRSKDLSTKIDVDPNVSKLHPETITRISHDSPTNSCPEDTKSSFDKSSFDNDTSSFDKSSFDKSSFEPSSRHFSKSSSMQYSDSSLHPYTQTQTFTEPVTNPYQDPKPSVSDIPKELQEKRPDITIINISDIIQNKEETIISPRDSLSITSIPKTTKTTEKRRRSFSSDSDDQRSPKRKTPSPNNSRDVFKNEEISISITMIDLPETQSNCGSVENMEGYDEKSESTNLESLSDIHTDTDSLQSVSGSHEMEQHSNLSEERTIEDKSNEQQEEKSEDHYDQDDTMESTVENHYEEEKSRDEFTPTENSFETTLSEDHSTNTMPEQYLQNQTEETVDHKQEEHFDTNDGHFGRKEHTFHREQEVSLQDLQSNYPDDQESLYQDKSEDRLESKRNKDHYKKQDDYNKQNESYHRMEENVVPKDHFDDIQDTGFHRRKNEFQKDQLPGRQNYHKEIGDYQNEPEYRNKEEYHNKPSDYQNQPEYHNKEVDYHNKTGDFQNKAGDFHNKAGDFHNKAGDFHNKAGDFHNKAGDFHNKTGDFHNKEGNFYNKAVDFHNKGGDFQNKPEGYHNKPEDHYQKIAYQIKPEDHFPNKSHDSYHNKTQDHFRDKTENRYHNKSENRYIDKPENSYNDRADGNFHDTQQKFLSKQESVYQNNYEDLKLEQFASTRSESFEDKPEYSELKIEHSFASISNTQTFLGLPINQGIKEPDDLELAHEIIQESIQENSESTSQDQEQDEATTEGFPTQILFGNSSQDNSLKSEIKEETSNSKTEEILDLPESELDDVHKLELHSHGDSMHSLSADHEVVNEQFQMLPNTLILHQESSLVLDKTCPENCENVTCIEAEKLEASVEESDLVFPPLVEGSFEPVPAIPDEEDANEDRFIDAENYVLEESGQISVSTSEKSVKDGGEEDIQRALFGAAVPTAEDCCWVDSSTEKLLEVPLHALDSVPVGMVGSENTTEHVEVIPMQEELEVRLEEGTFPVPTDWPYGVKMDSDMVAEALGNTDSGSSLPENAAQTQVYPEFSGNQVKLELEVTLTPEIVSSDSLVTSTVGGITSSGASSTVTPAVSQTVTTVIPPTTIVCLPSVVSTASMLNPTINQVTPTLPRSGMVQSSSALPYLQLSTSQPMRAVPTHSKTKSKNTQSNNNRNRGNNKPPPGAVNLERSYQICQAVIQNSPNRDQLRCQLKPPPSLLAAAATNNAKKVENNRQTQYGNVTSSRNTNKTFTPPLPASGTYQMVPGTNGVKSVKPRAVPYQQQRQPSPPVVVRHVFTSGQIPVTMAVLPQTQALSPEIVEGQNSMGHVGQYILVQRAGVGDHHNIPRSSSAPPSQQQIGTINTGTASHLVSVGSRGRPASVDLENQNLQNHPANDFIVQCPNPGTQAVTRRQRLPHGVVYGDVSVENQLQNYTIISENVMVDHPGAAMQSQLVLQQKARPSNIPASESSCPCSLKAMVVCKKCGAFCHDDCISPNKLCRVCFIR